MQNKTLMLIDGSYYLYRAYHGMPDLMNSQDEPTGAIFGVVNMLRKLLDKYKPDYLAAVFDASGKTFRNDMFPEYKAHRPPMPADLAQQISHTHEIIKALGIPLLIIKGVESDDVIGTLATAAGHYHLDTFISSGDKDLLQLVDENTRMINELSKIVFDAHEVEKKFGVLPGAIIDYLALIGDSADNVPGIPKVGPKTAVKWLKTYHSLENLVDHANEIKGKVGENLRGNLSQLWLSKQLVTLKLDVDLPYTPKQLLKTEVDTVALRRIYERWEFKGWLNELDYAGRDAGAKANLVTHAKRPLAKQSAGGGLSSGSPFLSRPVLSKPATVVNKKDYRAIMTLSELERWIERLSRSPLFAFATETKRLHYMRDELVGLSFSIIAGEAVYVPLAHDYADAPLQLSCALVLEKLKPLFEDAALAKLGRQLKYDTHVLANYGITLRGIKHEAVLQSYVFNSTTDHKMNELALRYLQYKTISYEAVAGRGSKQVTLNQVPLEQAVPYAAENVDITLQLHQALYPELTNYGRLQHIYCDVEMPLLSVLSSMERNGVMIDADMLGQQSIELDEKMVALEQQAYDLAGESFNINSPKQIREILYQNLNLQVLAKTPTGQASTSESVLQELAQYHALPNIILEHRGLYKLKTTYTDALPKQINSDTGRVHTCYQQAITATGRLSSTEPNLQNIPIRTEHGRRIRQAFIAAPQQLLLAADYSQIELCIMAHLSEDKNLLEAFINGQDIHRRTAAELFSIPIQAVDYNQRRTAKAINFGLIYGMSAFGLAKQLGINRGEAKRYIDHYFERYPGVKNYMQLSRERARNLGYVETVAGRRLYVPDINSSKVTQRHYAERTAINAPLQGTAADIIKLAMINIQAWLNEQHPDVRLIMQVHDELVFEIPENKEHILGEEIAGMMRQAVTLSVPLSVDVGVGKNWDVAH